MWNVFEEVHNIGDIDIICMIIQITTFLSYPLQCHNNIYDGNGWLADIVIVSAVQHLYNIIHYTTLYNHNAPHCNRSDTPRTQLSHLLYHSSSAGCSAAAGWLGVLRIQCAAMPCCQNSKKGFNILMGTNVKYFHLYVNLFWVNILNGILVSVLCWS